MVFRKYKLADNAVSNLDAGISASTTTATVTLWEGLVFPSDNFIATLVQYNTTADPTSWINKTEKVLCTIRDTDTLTITRGFDGDTATTFDTWDFIYLNVVAAITEDIQDEVTSLWSRVTTNEGDIDDLEADKADKTNVLEKDNTTAYTPTSDYHPATKKFVEDQGLNINGLTTVTTIPDTAEIPFYNPVSGVNENITVENFTGSVWFIASDTIQQSADTERTSTWLATFTKFKEIEVSPLYIAGETARVTFDYKWTFWELDFRKNGVSQVVLWDTSTTSAYISYSTDISLTASDTISIWLRWSWWGSSASVKNFRIKYDEVSYSKTPTINLN